MTYLRMGEEDVDMIAEAAAGGKEFLIDVEKVGLIEADFWLKPDLILLEPALKQPFANREAWTNTMKNKKKIY